MNARGLLGESDGIMCVLRSIHGSGGVAKPAHFMRTYNVRAGDRSRGRRAVAVFRGGTTEKGAAEFESTLICEGFTHATSRRVSSRLFSSRSSYSSLSSPPPPLSFKLSSRSLFRTIYCACRVRGHRLPSAARRIRCVFLPSSAFSVAA